MLYLFFYSQITGTRPMTSSTFSFTVKDHTTYSGFFNLLAAFFGSLASSGSHEAGVAAAVSLAVSGAINIFFTNLPAVSKAQPEQK